MQAKAYLSIVIPAFNEAKRLLPTLYTLRDFAESSGMKCEVIVVNDGSADDTSAVVRGFDLGPLGVRLIENESNRGKGFSVRRGALAASGDFILTADADMNCPIEQVNQLLAWAQRGFAVIIGSRAMADSMIDPPRNWRRRLSSYLFNRIRRWIILPAIRDTQCGFKCFMRSAGTDIFSAAVFDGYSADCEVLALALRMGYSVKEVGVRWESRQDSHIHILRDGWKMLRDLWAIRKRVRQFQPVANPAARR